MHIAPPSLLSPRPRTLQHPGPAAALRVNSRQGARSRHFRLQLTPGLSLFDALVQPLAAVGVTDASIVLLDGHFERLAYCVGQVDPTKTALFNYAEPRQAGRTYLLSGCATLGKNEAGEPMVHCHAALRTEGGEVKGGHIVTQASIVGPGSGAVLVTAFDGFGLRVMFDAETNISLFQPTLHSHDPS